MITATFIYSDYDAPKVLHSYRTNLPLVRLCCAPFLQKYINIMSFGFASLTEVPNDHSVVDMS